MPAMRGLSTDRGDAQDLLTLLCSIRADSLAYVREVAEQSHGDVRTWGQQALRIPGWDRGLWVAPLLALIRRCQGMERRSAAMSLRLLGAAAAAAAPALLELAGQEAGDRDYQYDLSLALHTIGEIVGVPLLAQLPPTPGQLGTCSYCDATGDCYCKRKGTADSEPCARCNGSGKCHACKGTGRLRP